MQEAARSHGPSLLPLLLPHLSGVGFSGLSLFCITASGSKSGMGGTDRGACALSHVTPRTVAHWTPLLWDFPGKNTGVGCHFLPQGIFLTEESNLHLLGL